MVASAISVSGLAVTRREFELTVDAFDIECGESVAVVGGNGSGKSTLLELILGLTPSSRGTVSLQGLPARQWMDDIDKRKTLGVQVQSERLPYFTTVGEQIAIHDALYGHPCDRRVLDALDIHALLRKRYETLSAGERQRCHLALALGHCPTLLFLDEPTAGLDARFRSNLSELLRDIHADSGKTMMFVTHDPAEVAFADTVLYSNGGRYSQKARLDELIESRLGEFKCEVMFESNDDMRAFSAEAFKALMPIRAFESSDNRWRGFGSRAHTETMTTQLTGRHGVLSFSLGRTDLSDLIGSSSWRAA